MKGRIIVGSLVAIFLILLVPVTNAVQIKTVEKDLSTSFISYDALKNMDADELIVFIRTLAQIYPQLYEEFQHDVDEMKNTPVSSIVTKHVSDIQLNKNQGPQQKSDNQTLLEKIFWKVFNYRLFRLYISTCLFIYFQSKFTLMRTMTWGIRLLRWVKIGILLGFIDPSQQPQTPNIACTTDSTTNRITVATADANIKWNDIIITNDTGSSNCHWAIYDGGGVTNQTTNVMPTSNVTAGDYIFIWYPSGGNVKITLRYVPTNSLLGSWTVNV